MPPIFLITGPPAAGKSTLCHALLQRFERGLHIPVDDLRLWVASGLSDSVPWTDETEQQFQLAEAAMCGVARTYHAAGYAVAIDHCRNLPRLEKVVQEHLGESPVVKVCLLPELETVLDRNRTRTNKPFDPAVLVETIQSVHAAVPKPPPPGWHLLDNTALTVEATVERVLGLRHQDPDR